MTRTTTAVSAATAVPLTDLAEEWYTALRAERKSPATIRTYRAGLTGNRRDGTLSPGSFLGWYSRNGAAEPVLDAPAVRAWLEDIAAEGQTAGTCRLRHAAVKRFARWLVAEGELDADPLTNVRPPQAREPNVPGLTDAELLAMLRACKTGPVFTSRRDEAILRLMADAGLRAGEVIGLETGDVDTTTGVVKIRKAKGGKHREVWISDQTAAALNRYLRLRRSHKLHRTPALFLPARGKSFAYQGLAKALGDRADDAKVPGFHLHRLRHTAASRWLEAGGSEDGAMARFGWSSHDMLRAYTKHTAGRRAIEEARRLGLGLPG